jgi:hypothetical protein
VISFWRVLIRPKFSIDWILSVMAVVWVLVAVIWLYTLIYLAGRGA